MSPLRETAIKLIQEIPDDKLVHVLSIIKGVKGLYPDPAELHTSKETAYHHLQQMRGQIPAELDYAEELAKSRAERYAPAN
ncbi:hypothetical protein AGMMS49983_01580 [Clostridia bacterium]|nr:hypothetical protein AGMMS49983_01580 [Clostridia bacterium]